MVDDLASDLRLYWRLIGIQVKAQAQYRASMALDIGTYLFVTLLEFTVIFLYFGQFPSIFGWRLGEVAMLAAVTSLSFGVAEMVGAGIDAFDDTVRKGEFDRVLLRPVNPFVQVLGSDFRLRRLGRMTQGAIGLTFALSWLPHFSWSLLKVLVLALGIASGAAIFLSVLLLGATVCFWTVQTTELTNIFTYGGREMLSWPFPIYSQTLQRIFLFIVPLAFGCYVPTCFALGRALPLGMPAWVALVGPVSAALIFSMVAAAIWRMGVRHYQSTGS
jgi:ABC-2 type transport system permease protein